eukprot:TRINITY_DN3448_c0_g1_i1.p1 TRINITY_DN3448_c0_g1~~TRINITY_DN3448_c0_g1_i1.p1  ORF type:complete len:1983 (+),score=692.55 TRINITY_DN3448_c0_g1_i1:64-6012(+)
MSGLEGSVRSVAVATPSACSLPPRFRFMAVHIDTDTPANVKPADFVAGFVSVFGDSVVSLGRADVIDWFRDLPKDQDAEVAAVQSQISAVPAGADPSPQLLAHAFQIRFAAAARAAAADDDDGDGASLEVCGRTASAARVAGVYVRQPGAGDWWSRSDDPSCCIAEDAEGRWALFCGVEDAQGTGEVVARTVQPHGGVPPQHCTAWEQAVQAGWAPAARLTVAAEARKLFVLLHDYPRTVAEVEALQEGGGLRLHCCLTVDADSPIGVPDPAAADAGKGKKPAGKGAKPAPKKGKGEADVPELPTESVHKLLAQELERLQEARAVSPLRDIVRVAYTAAPVDAAEPAAEGLCAEAVEAAAHLGPQLDVLEAELRGFTLWQTSAASATLTVPWLAGMEPVGPATVRREEPKSPTSPVKGAKPAPKKGGKGAAEPPPKEEPPPPPPAPSMPPALPPDPAAVPCDMSFYQRLAAGIPDDCASVASLLHCVVEQVVRTDATRRGVQKVRCVTEEGVKEVQALGSQAEAAPGIGAAITDVLSGFGLAAAKEPPPTSGSRGDALRCFPLEQCVDVAPPPEVCLLCRRGPSEPWGLSVSEAAEVCDVSGVAAESGLKPGARITAVDGTAVAAADAAAAVTAVTGNEMRLTVLPSAPAAGVVVGHSRGRVGVALGSGRVVGVPPSHLTAVRTSTSLPASATDVPLGDAIAIRAARAKAPSSIRGVPLQDVEQGCLELLAAGGDLLERPALTPLCEGMPVAANADEAPPEEPAERPGQVWLQTDGALVIDEDGDRRELRRGGTVEEEAEYADILDRAAPIFAGGPPVPLPPMLVPPRSPLPPLPPGLEPAALAERMTPEQRERERLLLSCEAASKTAGYPLCLADRIYEEELTRSACLQQLVALESLPQPPQRVVSRLSADKTAIVLHHGVPESRCRWSCVNVRYDGRVYFPEWLSWRRNVDATIPTQAEFSETQSTEETAELVPEPSERKSAEAASERDGSAPASEADVESHASEAVRAPEPLLAPDDDLPEYEMRQLRDAIEELAQRRRDAEVISSREAVRRGAEQRLRIDPLPGEVDGVTATTATLFPTDGSQIAVEVSAGAGESVRCTVVADGTAVGFRAEGEPIHAAGKEDGVAQGPVFLPGETLKNPVYCTAALADGGVASVASKIRFDRDARASLLVEMVYAAADGWLVTQHGSSGEADICPPPGFAGDEIVTVFADGVESKLLLREIGRRVTSRGSVVRFLTGGAVQLLLADGNSAVRVGRSWLVTTAAARYGIPGPGEPAVQLAQHRVASCCDAETAAVVTSRADGVFKVDGGPAVSGGGRSVLVSHPDGTRIWTTTKPEGATQYRVECEGWPAVEILKAGPQTLLSMHDGVVLRWAETELAVKHTDGGYLRADLTTHKLIFEPSCLPPATEGEDKGEGIYCFDYVRGGMSTIDADWTTYEVTGRGKVFVSRFSELGANHPLSTSADRATSADPWLSSRFEAACGHLPAAAQEFLAPLPTGLGPRFKQAKAALTDGSAEGMLCAPPASGGGSMRSTATAISHPPEVFVADSAALLPLRDIPEAAKMPLWRSRRAVVRRLLSAAQLIGFFRWVSGEDSNSLSRIDAAAQGSCAVEELLCKLPLRPPSSSAVCLTDALVPRAAATQCRRGRRRFPSAAAPSRTVVVTRRLVRYDEVPSELRLLLRHATRDGAAAEVRRKEHAAELAVEDLRSDDEKAAQAECSVRLPAAETLAASLLSFGIEVTDAAEPVVSSLAPGSAGEAGGVRVGWRVTSVAGAPADLAAAVLAPVTAVFKSKIAAQLEKVLGGVWKGGAGSEDRAREEPPEDGDNSMQPLPPSNPKPQRAARTSVKPDPPVGPARRKVIRANGGTKLVFEASELSGRTLAATPASVSLGAVEVGGRAEAVVRITNTSRLAARIALRLRSGRDAVAFVHKRGPVPPGGAVDVRVVAVLRPEHFTDGAFSDTIESAAGGAVVVSVPLTASLR